MKVKLRRGFTLIETLIIVAVLALLALLALPRLAGYTKKANQSRLTHDAKLLEDASQAYYLTHGDWPRLSDVPYSAAEVTAFADQVYDKTGAVVVLDETGSYYDIDIQKTNPYITLFEDPRNFVLQNPVGSVYVLNHPTDTRLAAGSTSGPGPAPAPAATKPVAVIGMTPSTGLTTSTTIVWDTAGSYDTNSGGTLTATQWTGAQSTYATAGTYTVSLRVQNNAGLWSDPASVTFAVAEAAGIQQVAAGGDYTLFLMSDGTVRAWGRNQYGQLGLGSADTATHATPVTIPGLTNVAFLAAGSRHALAILKDGTLKAWGRNDYGQIGLGGTSDQWSPVTVPGISGVKQVAAGGYHTLAVLNDGTLVGWGRANNGQLAIDTLDVFIDTPTAIATPTNVRQVAAGDFHSVALLADGTLSVWGDNQEGQLGIGSTTSQWNPVTVPGLTDVTRIAAGTLHTLALLTDGSVKAWGYNAHGELGIGNKTNQPQPTLIPGLTGVSQVSALMYFSAALLSDGGVRAWGQNGYGQLGIGTVDTSDHPSPAVVTGITSARQIAAGNAHALALLHDGTLMAWGSNVFGELGLGTTTTQCSPVAVIGLN